MTIIDFYSRQIHQTIEQQIESKKTHLEEKIIKIEKASQRINDIVKSMQVLTHGSYQVQTLNLLSEIEAAKEYLSLKLQGGKISFYVSHEEGQEDFTFKGNSTQVQQVLILIKLRPIGSACWSCLIARKAVRSSYEKSKSSIY